MITRRVAELLKASFEGARAFDRDAASLADTLALTNAFRRSFDWHRVGFHLSPETRDRMRSLPLAAQDEIVAAVLVRVALEAELLNAVDRERILRKWLRRYRDRLRVTT